MRAAMLEQSTSPNGPIIRSVIAQFETLLLQIILRISVIVVLCEHSILMKEQIFTLKII